MTGSSHQKHGPLAAVEKPKTLPKRLAPLTLMPNYDGPIAGVPVAAGPIGAATAMYERLQKT